MNNISDNIFKVIVDMVKVRPKDLDYTETRAIGWVLSMLAIVAAKNLK